MANIFTILAVALLWTVFVGEFSPFNVFVGGMIALLLLSVLQRSQDNAFPKRVVAFLRFIAQFFSELIVANFAIAKLAIVAKPQFHPHIIAVPLRVKSDAAISLLSATITLLPGTVAMGVSEHKDVLYAHAIGEEDVQKAHDSITRIETLILGFMN